MPGKNSRRRRDLGRLRFEALEDRSMMAAFVVDDSFAGDNAAQRRYNTIQEAVDAASAGDQIQVRPGTYEENVVVNKRLTIRGEDPRLGDALDPNKASIVDPVDDGAAGSPAYGFNLQANDVKIEGFTIAERDGVTDADGTVGVNTSASFSGYSIRENVIQDNTFGMYLNTSVAANARTTEVRDNVIRDNNTGLGVLAAAGNGIYSDQGARNVQITKNDFTGHGNEDVIFVAPTALQSNITVRDNTLRDSSGVFFINVADSKIQGNLIERSFANAIELAGGNTDVTIKNNILRNVGTDGYNGIFLHDNFGVGANTGNTIANNLIVDAGLSGIVIRASSSNTIKENAVFGSKGFDLSNPTWGNGIGLENATNNRVENNVVAFNARDGVFADIASSGNLIKGNLAFGNDEHDYHDDSVGTQTAGTANTYQNNFGRTQNRTGLIRHIV